VQQQQVKRRKYRNQTEREKSYSTKDVDGERQAVWKATQFFLGQPIELQNVAHAVVPIQCTSVNANKRKRKHHKKGFCGPIMKVSMIVAGPMEERNYDGGETVFDKEEYQDLVHNYSSVDNQNKILKSAISSSSSASMQLVRMVNNIPMLDSSEALACGLVQGIVAKNKVWNAFGLDVHSVSPKSPNAQNCDTKTPSFDVQDSSQIAPFFSKGSHALLEDGFHRFENESDINSKLKRDQEQDGNEIGGDDLVIPKEKKQKSSNGVFLPAALRLGNILIIAQIQAEPTILPLPTLSKVRKQQETFEFRFSSNAIASPITGTHSYG
jgi:hypothetical protein